MTGSEETGVNDPEELEATGAPASGEIAASTTLGPVHLTVADLDRWLEGRPEVARQLMRALAQRLTAQQLTRWPRENRAGPDRPGPGGGRQPPGPRSRPDGRGPARPVPRRRGVPPGGLRRPHPNPPARGAPAVGQAPWSARAR